MGVTLDPIPPSLWASVPKLFANVSTNEHPHLMMGNLVFLDRNSNWRIFRHCGWQQGKDLRAGGDFLESLK